MPPIWKPLVIVIVLALAGLSLYPIDQQLKPGLDLRGGTVLVYQVDVPADRDASTVLNQTIEILKNRVDPNGVRNLIWRKRAGNRIGIQMPLPPETVSERRQAFMDAREKLFEQNLDPQRIESALRAEPERREELLGQIAEGQDDLRQRLSALAEAWDKMRAAEKPYREAEQARREAEHALEELPEDADQEKRDALAQRVEERRRATVEPARAYRAARETYEQKRRAVLEANLTPAELERVLQLPTDPRAGEDESPRAKALAELIETHPSREEAIRRVAEAWASYEKVKGPLDDPQDLIELLKGSGQLAFRIGASSDNVDVERYRERLRESGPRAGRDKPYQWLPLQELSAFAENAEERQAAREDPAGWFARRRNMVAAAYGGRIHLLLADTAGDSLTPDQPDWELTSVGRTQDQTGLPAVRFELNAVGAQLMGEMTSNHVDEPMAIVLDGEVISAPTVQDRIAGRGIITGGRSGFSDQEIDYLLRTLRAGAPPGELSEEPISIKKIGPRLGQDNLQAGLRAAIGALVVVGVFIAGYYLFWGLLADFALVANMVLILGVMALLKATFTLPGIAGIVLTIGMAVDANVLIFERIREERFAGSRLVPSIRMGYDRALSAVVDANLTTLITCIILGYTATAEVKGFAVTLGIGIIATLFTALFCTRVLADSYVAAMRPRGLPMLPTVLPALQRLLSPRLNWIRMRGIFFTASLILLIASFGLLTARGADILDIQFRSGTQVVFHLKEGEKLALQAARNRLTEAVNARTQEVETEHREAAEELAQARQQDAGEQRLRTLRRRERALSQRLDALPQLKGDRVTLLTVGESEGAKASGFSVATLVTHEPDVRAVIQDGFSDLLETKRPIDFKGMEQERVGAAPVHPITNARLGANINRPELDVDAGAFLGGVAVVLENLAPAATVQELQQRVERMQMQPGFDDMGFRRTKVVGLDLAEGASDDGATRYRSAAVLATDGRTHYGENPETFTDAEGLAQTQWALVREAMQRGSSLASVSNFSSQVSSTMQRQALLALGLSLLAVLAYIWFRFGSFRYGIAALAALSHDVLLSLGAVAASTYIAATVLGSALLIDPFRIDLSLVAAVLTIIGYSLNDTIVVFDRVRENRGRRAYATRGIVNRSINQVFSRTVLTSGSTLLALLVLYIFGGQGVHHFAFTLIIGVIAGTYSSIGVACPILLIGQPESAEDAEEENPAPYPEQTPEPA